MKATRQRHLGYKFERRRQGSAKKKMVVISGKRIPLAMLHTCYHTRGLVRRTHLTFTRGHAVGPNTGRWTYIDHFCHTFLEKRVVKLSIQIVGNFCCDFSGRACPVLLVMWTRQVPFERGQDTYVLFGTFSGKHKSLDSSGPF